MKIEITPAQLEAIKNMTDDISAMIGANGEDADATWARHVKAVDRMLAKNKLEPRKYK